MTSLLASPSSTSIDGLVGVQRPRIHKTPPYERSLGAEVVDFMDHVGKPLDEWQAFMVMDTFGLRSDGYWSAFEAVGLIPRQNGKGGYSEAVELGGLFLFGDQIIMHSAHLFKTAKQSFQRLIDIIDGSDWLTKRVAKVVRARGDEEIQLTSRAGGGRLLCFSRHGGAGRGFTGDKTVFDECAYLTVEQYQAATPTLATVPNPQIIYTGTPPDEDVGPMPADAMMPSVRKRAHAGEDRIAVWEWSPPDGFDRTDPRIWAACNPSLGIRIMPWFLAQQLRNFAAAGRPEKFDTEHLGVWPVDAATHWAVISEADWSALTADQQSSALDPLVFSIDVTPERSHGSIAAVGARADGDLHGEVVDHGPGTSWLAERAVELNQRWRPAFWVLDPGGAAGFLLPQLEAAGLVVETMTTRQVGQAFGLFRSSASSAEQAEAPTSEATLTGAPVEPEAPLVVPKIRIRLNRHGGALSAAVEGAATRRVGDGTSWDRKSNAVVISPLVALTNAMFGFVTRPPVETNEPWVMYG